MIDLHTHLDLYPNALDILARVNKENHIHSRGAASKILSVIKKYPGCGTPILHWFSGSIAELKEAIEMRCYFSVNSLMLKRKRPDL